jgi:peptidyl-tRNA hydrolase, PTH1 family
VRLFRRSEKTGSDGRWIIVGLGNPGARYENTRHNVGVKVLELLLERAGASLKRHKSGCLAAEVEISGERCVLARSMSFMNETGGPVGKLVRWYKADPDHVVVVHDEIDIPFGEVRVKFGGGTAGHNGLRSLASHLGTNEFIRVRVGVSRPQGRRDAAGHVLDEFSRGEQRELSEIVERAADAVESIVTTGVERTMNEVNTRVR